MRTTRSEWIDICSPYVSYFTFKYYFFNINVCEILVNKMEHLSMMAYSDRIYVGMELGPEPE